MQAKTCHKPALEQMVLNYGQDISGHNAADLLTACLWLDLYKDAALACEFCCISNEVVKNLHQLSLVCCDDRRGLRDALLQGHIFLDQLR